MSVRGAGRRRNSYIPSLLSYYEAALILCDFWNIHSRLFATALGYSRYRAAVTSHGAFKVDPETEGMSFSLTYRADSHTGKAATMFRLRTVSSFDRRDRSIIGQATMYRRGRAQDDWRKLRVHDHSVARNGRCDDDGAVAADAARARGGSGAQEDREQ